MKTQEGLNKALFKAIKENKVNEIESLLFEGANIEAKDDLGCTPLFIALSYIHNNKASNKLIELGANRLVKNNSNVAPIDLELKKAVMSGNIHDVEKLAKEGADINSVLYKSEYSTLLHEVAMKNDPEMIEMLVFLKVKIDIKDDSGRTSLITALYYDNIKAANKLIDLGANRFIKDNSNTASIDLEFRLALISRNSAKMKQLVKEGVNINRNIGGMFPGTALHKAAEKDDHEIITLLISLNADINSKNNYLEQTPLYTALYDNKVEAAKLLANYGAKIDEDTLQHVILMKVENLAKELQDLSDNFYKIKYISKDVFNFFYTGILDKLSEALIDEMVGEIYNYLCQDKILSENCEESIALYGLSYANPEFRQDNVKSIIEQGPKLRQIVCDEIKAKTVTSMQK